MAFTPARPLASLAVLVALALLAFATPPRASAQTPAWVDTGGDCLRMRDAPGLESGDLRCLEHGDPVTMLAATQELDGFTWREVEFQGQTGWVAEFYLSTDPADVQPLEEPASGRAGALPTPPAGGLTLGVAGATDPAAVAAAQGFTVAGIWHLDVESQRWLNFIPGAPAHANTLTALDPHDVVMVRREGALVQVGALPEASLTVAGTPNALPAPPVGGLTQGVSGSTDPRFVVQAQPFTVEAVAYFHVGSQQWLVYIPDAPPAASSLQQGQMRTDSIVTLRRGPDRPKPPSSEDSTYFETSITYYYCVPGDNPASIGDGGGYCGAMSTGERVHEGAAACAPRHLGQRFRIDGDPTQRVYTCKDAGGSVLQDHRDIWFMDSDDGYAWWQDVGERAFITILPD